MCIAGRPSPVSPLDGAAASAIVMSRRRKVRVAFQRTDTSIGGLPPGTSGRPPAAGSRSGWSSTTVQSPTIQSRSASRGVLCGDPTRDSRRLASFHTPSCLTQVAENHPVSAAVAPGGVTSTVPSSMATSALSSRSCVCSIRNAGRGASLVAGVICPTASRPLSTRPSSSTMSPSGVQKPSSALPSPRSKASA